MSIDRATLEYVWVLKQRVVAREAELTQALRHYTTARERMKATTPHRPNPDSEWETFQYLTVRREHPVINYWYSDVEHQRKLLVAQTNVILAVKAAHDLSQETITDSNSSAVAIPATRRGA